VTSGAQGDGMPDKQWDFWIITETRGPQHSQQSALRKQKSPCLSPDARTRGGRT